MGVALFLACAGLVGPLLNSARFPSTFLFGMESCLSWVGSPPPRVPEAQLAFSSFSSLTKINLSEHRLNRKQGRKALSRSWNRAPVEASWESCPAGPKPAHGGPRRAGLLSPSRRWRGANPPALTVSSLDCLLSPSWVFLAPVGFDSPASFPRTHLPWLGNPPPPAALPI